MYQDSLKLKNKFTHLNHDQNHYILYKGSLVYLDMLFSFICWTCYDFHSNNTRQEKVYLPLEFRKRELLVYELYSSLKVFWGAFQLKSVLH